MTLNQDSFCEYCCVFVVVVGGSGMPLESSGPVSGLWFTGLRVRTASFCLSLVRT